MMSSDPHRSLAGHDRSGVSDSSLDFSLSYSLYSGGSLMQPPSLRARQQTDHDVVVGVHPGHQRPPHLSHHVPHQPHQGPPPQHQQQHGTHQGHLSHQTSHHAHSGPTGMLGHQMSHLTHQGTGHPHQNTAHSHQGPSGLPHQGTGLPHQGVGHPHQNSPHQHQASPLPQHQGSPHPQHQNSPHGHQGSSMTQHQSASHTHSQQHHHQPGPQHHHQGSGRHHQPHLQHQSTIPPHHGLQGPHHQQHPAHQTHTPHQTLPGQHVRQGPGPGIPGQGSSVSPQQHSSALDDAWRNVAFDETVGSSKRQMSHAIPNTFARTPLQPEKRARTDGTFNGDSLLFKSSLDGAIKMETSSADLLSGISESFDFASSGDAPDDNSSLAQSISLIQQTLDQSIAQAECLGSSGQQQQQQQQPQPQQPQQSVSTHSSNDQVKQEGQLRLEDPRQRDPIASQPLVSAQSRLEQPIFPRPPLLSPAGSMSNCTQQSSSLLSSSTPISPPTILGTMPPTPRVPTLPNGAATMVSSLASGSSSSFDSLTPVDCQKPVTLKEYRLVFTEQVFERNGQIIRRQLVQREQVLERTIQLTSKQMDSVLQFGPVTLGPCDGPDSGEVADISTNNRTSLPRSTTESAGDKATDKSQPTQQTTADLTPITPMNITVNDEPERRLSLESSTPTPTTAVKDTPATSTAIVENGKSTGTVPPPPSTPPSDTAAELEKPLEKKPSTAAKTIPARPRGKAATTVDDAKTKDLKIDDVDSESKNADDEKPTRSMDDRKQPAAGKDEDKVVRDEEMKDAQTAEKGVDTEAKVATSAAAGSETDETGSLEPGSMCLAQWSDELFYMATIVKVYKNGRCVVNFADGTHDTVKAVQVVALTELEVGQDVYVKVRNNFEFGVIKGKTMVNQAAGYVAELHNKKTLRITRDRIVLTMEMVNMYRERLKNKTAITEPTSLEKAEKGLKDLKVSVNNRATPRRGRGLSSALDVTSSEAEGERIGTKTRRVRYGRSEASVSGMASVSGGGVSGSSLNPPTLVFEGMGFLLTDTERTVKDFYSSSGTTTDDSPFDSASSCGEQVEFNKEQLQALIEENGGVVFKSFSEAECASSLDTGIQERFLLARSHMKTLKYVLCLAAGIRCLGYQVVHAALREGKMPHPAKYQLPAGISVLTKSPIEQPGVHSPIFAEMTIAVVSEQNQFVNTWSQVIVAAGGRIVSKLPQRQSPQKSAAANRESTAGNPDGPIRFMVTQPDCSSLSLRSARSLRVSPVSSEWVVQSIIHAKVLEADAHPSFAHDFKKD